MTRPAAVYNTYNGHQWDLAGIPSTWGVVTGTSSNGWLALCQNDSLILVGTYETDPGSGIFWANVVTESGSLIADTPGAWAIASTERYCFGAGSDGLYVIDCGSGTPTLIDTLSPPSYSWTAVGLRIATSPNGDFVAVSYNSPTSTIALYDANTFDLLWSDDGFYLPSWLVFSVDSSTLFAASKDNAVSVYAINTSSYAVTDITAPSGYTAIADCAVTADGQYLLVPAEDEDLGYHLLLFDQSSYAYVDQISGDYGIINTTQNNPIAGTAFCLTHGFFADASAIGIFDLGALSYSQVDLGAAPGALTVYSPSWSAVSTDSSTLWITENFLFEITENGRAIATYDIGTDSLSQDYEIGGGETPVNEYIIAIAPQMLAGWRSGMLP